LVYFRNSHTQGIADNQFIYGDPGDRLVAGDWTGNGFDSPGLFRPSNTTWYLRWSNTQGNADESFVWGRSAWLPVAGEFGQLTPPTTTTTTVAPSGDLFAGVPEPSSSFDNETVGPTQTCRYYSSGLPPYTVAKNYQDVLDQPQYGWDVGELFSTGYDYTDTASFPATRDTRSMKVVANGAGSLRSTMSVCIERT
jgi:hypothetical protein